MHLKEVEILGFKSFPQKVSLKFEPGITVVVGPNGCGKSNILDSIKWALGEQSPKSLRGSKMEDIIFNGTEHHPPLNYADVTLIFSNEDNYLPIEYKEVSVSRRLYRSGESEYYINKNIVRLKDVETLFMGTGIGESTYSFVEQGRIEIFLGYKPEDKRLIFDEASGIVKYKERKKETMRKLEDAENNLVRLEDIISEVTRQIRYLERQVSKAKRYKENEEKLVEIEKKIGAHKFVEIKKKMDAALEQLNGFVQKEQEKEHQIEELHGKGESLNNQHRAIHKIVEDTNAVIVSLTAQVEHTMSHIALYHQRIKELQERLVAMGETEDNLKQRLALHDQRITEEENALQRIEETISAFSQEAVKMHEEQGNLNVRLAAWETEINSAKTKILECETQRVVFHNELIEIQTHLASFEKRKVRLALDKVKLENLICEKKQAFDRIDEEVKKVEASVAVLKERKSVLLFKEKELEIRKETLKNQTVDKEKELLELNSYYEFLKDLRVKYDTFSLKQNVTIVFNEEPKNINTVIASLKGVEFSQDGNVYKAEVEAKIVSFEEGQLQEKIQSVQREIEEMKRLLAETHNELEMLQQEVSSEDIQIDSEEKKWQEVSQRKDILAGDCQRLNEELGFMDQEAKETFAEMERYAVQQKEVQTHVDVYNQELEDAQACLVKNQQEIVQGKEQLRLIELELARRDAQTQAFDREKETLASKLSLLNDEKTNIFTTLDSLAKERVDGNQRMESFNQEINTLNEKIQTDKLQIEAHNQKREEMKKDEDALLLVVQEYKQTLASGEKELEEIKSAIYSKKLQIQELEYESTKIKDYLEQVYHVAFDTASCDANENLEDLLVQKEELQKKKISLGEVNLIAIEEFEELQKRETFLQNQKQDLVTAKEELKKAIQKINRTSKELFLDTFAKIEEEFKKNFRFLFGGGRAQLILLDQENVLESGVEIEVQPPGKKLQGVSLLSGGEKALTALALIFAIFKVRPSPLCVLDEIDAPLDETNVGRFNHLLKEFASFSQFLLITHNKRTMSNADVLYGVTMEEKGVSKVVSVRFASQDAAPTAIPNS